MEDFGGRNATERSLRALLETRKVFCTHGSVVLFDLYEDISDDQGNKLGQFLLGLGRPVHSLILGLDSLTATGKYHSLLQFIEQGKLQKLSLPCFLPMNASSHEHEEVYDRFLMSVARSTTIDDLSIDARHVSLESFLDFLRQNKSITSLRMENSNDEWPIEAIENALVHQSTVTFLRLYHEQDSTLVSGAIRALKRSPVIERLFINAAFPDAIHDDTTPDLRELVEAIPSFPSLRSLKIALPETYPDTLHAAIMDGVRRNFSLNEVSIETYQRRSFLRPTRNRRVAQDVAPYMERNRAIRRTFNTPNLPEALIPNMAAAAHEKFDLGKDLIFDFLKEHPQVIRRRR